MDAPPWTELRKKLVLIEAAYRSLKTIDLKTRPIRRRAYELLKSMAS